MTTIERKIKKMKLKSAIYDLAIDLARTRDGTTTEEYKKGLEVFCRKLDKLLKIK